MEIRFDVEDLLGELTTWQKTQLPYATSRGMSDLRPALTNGLRDRIKNGRIFNKHVPLTDLSPLASPVVERRLGSDIEYSFQFFIRDQADKGTAPAVYLHPTMTGTKVYRTKFYKSPQIRNIINDNQYLIPTPGSSAVRLNVHGNMMPSQYRVIMDKLSAEKQNGIRYFFAKPGQSALAPGIYQVKNKKSAPVQAMFFVNQTPSVPRIWSFWDQTNQIFDSTAGFVLDGWLTKAMQ